MTIMYELPVFMPESCTVEPIDVMYQLPNYHARPESISSPSTNGVSNGSNGVSGEHVHDPSKMIEKKQLDLLQRLTSLGDKLNDMLKQKGAAAAKGKDKAVTSTQKAPAKEASPAAQGKDGKKDKDAKKEARKAAKADAKNKVAGGAPSSTQKSGKAAGVEGKSWIVKEEKKSTETGQSLTACTQPELANFKKQALSNVCLSVTTSDLPWVKALSAIAEKRGVTFKGAVSNKSTSTDSVVEVKQADKFSLKSSDLSLNLRIPSWKLLGAAMGLFSFEHTHTLQACHQHQWLAKLDNVLNSRETIVNVTREASQFLSSFDSLGSHFDIGVADIVLRSLLAPGNLPNNVELWAKRVDSL